MLCVLLGMITEVSYTTGSTKYQYTVLTQEACTLHDCFI